MGAETRNVVIVSHLPGLSMDPDDEGPFLYSNSAFQRLTFEQYEALTLGAYQREREYEEVKPVFYVTEIATDLDTAPRKSRPSALQMKARSGTDFAALVPLLIPFQPLIELGVSAWKCLSLGLPMTGLISPRHSVTFIEARKPNCFFFQGNPHSAFHLQGDADHEYLFATRFVSSPATRTQLQFAERQKELVEIIEEDATLQAAFKGFLHAQHPALSRLEHAILCIVQLEELLLGDSTLNLRREFTRRAWPFVPVGQHGIFDERDVRALYDLRSAYFHGRIEANATSDQNILALAPALLASVIRSFATAIKTGASCQDLAGGDANLLAKSALQDDWEVIDRFRIDNRFSNHRHSVVSSLTGSMGAPEHKAVHWSPMLGLNTTETAIRIGRRLPEVMMPLSLDEMMVLEDRDVRGDFLEGTRGFALVDPEIGDGRSVLLTLLDDVELDLHGDLVSRTHASIRSTVIALRALGFHHFCDPQLLGDYRYVGKIRMRRPTVFRQTVLGRAIKSADTLTAADETRVGDVRDLVLQSHDRFRSLRSSLDLFRKSFFHPVLSDSLRARISFAFIESGLDRFHVRQGEPPIEEMAGVVASGDIGMWFNGNARMLRNELAHSSDVEVKEADLAALLSFCSHLALRLVRHTATPGLDDQSFRETFRDQILETLSI